MGRRTQKLHDGNKIYIKHHAMQRRLEADGHDTSFIFTGNTDPIDKARRAAVCVMMLRELSDSQLISYQQTQIFRHPGRYRTADDALYYLTDDFNFCYVVKNNNVITVIPVSENQYQTLMRMLEEDTEEPQTSTDTPPVSQVKEIEPNLEVQKLKDLNPVLQNEMGKLWMIIGLDSTQPVISADKLKKLFNMFFEIFDFDCFRVVYNERVTHLHRGENTLAALNGRYNHVPAYWIDLSCGTSQRQLLESGSMSCPTIIITNAITARDICTMLNNTQKEIRIPASFPWIAYFAHSAKTMVEGAIPLGKKFNFAA
ncbi:MAG: hypothetical protein P1P90_01215 [Patescibacteria group bacterium]|nr:hypothetical protein [Patescibacteria group bacterium]